MILNKCCLITEVYIILMHTALKTHQILNSVCNKYLLQRVLLENFQKINQTDPYCNLNPSLNQPHLQPQQQQQAQQHLLLLLPVLSPLLLLLLLLLLLVWQDLPHQNLHRMFQYWWIQVVRFWDLEEGLDLGKVMLKCRVQILGGVLFVIKKIPGLLWRLQLCVISWDMRGKGLLHQSPVCAEYFSVSSVILPY